MTENEKNIYNTYLAVSHKIKNRPFRLRKNFDKFDETQDYVYIKKIENIFKQLPQINREWYFEAPYKIYEDQTYFDLKYFASQRAIKTYTIYLKLKKDQDPDSENILLHIKKSLHFIAKYCIANHIKIDDYITHKDGVTFAWLQHIKNTNINLYTIFYYQNILQIIDNLHNSEKEIFFGDSYNKLHVYKRRLLNSQKAKYTIDAGMKKIKKYVDNI
jgi:hypothetical protein